MLLSAFTTPLWIESQNSIIHILKAFLAKEISSREVCVFGRSTGQTDSNCTVNSQDLERFLRFQVNPLHNQKKKVPETRVRLPTERWALAHRGVQLLEDFNVSRFTDDLSSRGSPTKTGMPPVCKGELDPLPLQKRLRHITEISNRQHLPRIFARSLPPPPQLLGLRGTRRCPARAGQAGGAPSPAGRMRPAGRCAPSIPMEIPRWMRPGGGPGPGGSSRPLLPLRAA